MHNMSAELTIKRLVHNMNVEELLNINGIVIGRIKVLQAKKLKEKKDLLTMGDKVTFKLTKSFLAEPGPWTVHRKRVKCRGHNVGVILSIARSYAQVRVGPKTFKCHISGLEKTNYAEGSWFEKPGVWIRNPEGAWPTLVELIPKDTMN